jgi:PAS domain S-box-containing protein
MSFFLAFLASAIFTGLMTVLCYRRRSVTGALTLMWLMLALTWWSGAYAIETLNTTLGWHKFWSAVEYVSIATVPVLWMIFALQYSQQETAPTMRSLAWLWVVPIITNIMVWTNDWHRQVWPNIELVVLNGTTMMQVDHGLYFWIHAVYSYINIFTGIVIFIRQAAKEDRAYRSQASLTLIAAAILLLGNTLYLFNLLPFKGLDITPFSFAIASGFLALALFRHRMLDLMPIANEIILNNMGDGILVLDARDRVIYINPAFEAIAGLPPGFAVGENIHKLLGNWPNIFQRYAQKSTTEIEIEISGLKRVIELLVSPLIRNNSYEGCIYVIRDITERLDLENRLRLSLEITQKNRADEFIFIAFEAQGGKILDVNNEFVVSTGFGREQVLGRTALQIGLWEVETRTNILRMVRDKGQIIDMPVKILSRSGQAHNWKLSVTTTSLDGREIQVWMAKNQ